MTRLSRIGTIILSLCGCLLTGCNSTVEVNAEMFWDCDPPDYGRERPWFPVELRFVESPSHIVYLTDRSICSALSKSGKKTATVRFQVYGNRLTGVVRGSLPISIETVPLLPDASAGAASDGDDSSPPDPLLKAFK